MALARDNEYGATEIVHVNGHVVLKLLKARIGKKAVTTGLGFLGSVVVD